MLYVRIRIFFSIFVTIVECFVLADRDECELGFCHTAGTRQCVNTAGSYNCVCNDGYIGTNCTAGKQQKYVKEPICIIVLTNSDLRHCSQSMQNVKFIFCLMQLTSCSASVSAALE